MSSLRCIIASTTTVVFTCCLFPMLLRPGDVSAQPIAVEPGWTLLRTIETTGPMAAHFNPRDGRIYFGKRGSGADGLYRIDDYGFSERLASGSNAAGVVVQPDSGHVFLSEDYGGYIYRTEFGGTGRGTWVSGFRESRDDDPVGMAFAPAHYTGAVLQPGDALSVDRGNNGYDDVWCWSPLVAQGEYLVHPDDGTLTDPVDVCISATHVYIADAGATTGGIYILAADSTLTQLPTAVPLVHPEGITEDPLTGDLLVMERGLGRLVRIDPGTGAVSEVVTGLTTSYVFWAGVDMSPDGRRLFLTDHDAEAIYVFARCDATGMPDIDCDGNNVYDLCDVTLGGASDCNHNGVPDDCDLSSGTSEDCNLDGRPDDCPVCGPVEVVFVMDTSTSMNDEAAALCSNMGLIVDYLVGAGIDVRPTLFGICNNPGGDYACLEAIITDSLGTVVPGSPPGGLEILGNCPGGNEVCQEDWGLAAAVVAGEFGWLPPDSQAVRLIIPLSDEGSWCGDPVTQNDHDAVTHAIGISRENGVIVSPITGTGSSSSVLALAQSIADSTGGTHFRSSELPGEIAYSIVQLVLDACAAFQDCDRNGRIDECEIADHPSLDFNGDGILDKCQYGVVGVGQGRVPWAGVRLHAAYPNPFNPRTVIAFDLPVRSRVSLRVYDLSGRLVDVLIDGAFADEGRNEAEWWGRDAAGRAVAAGVYFYRLEVGDFGETRRMALVK